MIAYTVQVEDAMLIVPVNLPSFEVPAVPPQTASSSPSTTGNTRRDGPYERFNMRPLPRSFGAFGTAAPSAPAGQRAAHATEHRHQAAKRWAKRTAGRRYDSPVQAKAAEALRAFARSAGPQRARAVRCATRVSAWGESAGACGVGSRSSVRRASV